MLPSGFLVRNYSGLKNYTPTLLVARSTTDILGGLSYYLQTEKILRLWCYTLRANELVSSKRSKPFALESARTSDKSNSFKKFRGASLTRKCSCKTKTNAIKYALGLRLRFGLRTRY